MINVMIFVVSVIFDVCAIRFVTPLSALCLPTRTKLCGPQISFDHFLFEFDNTQKSLLFVMTVDQNFLKTYCYSCVRIYATLRSKLKKHFGDFSFSSFVKMITQEGKRVDHLREGCQ